MTEKLESIGEREFVLFRDLIYKESGITLNESKKALLEARLSKRMRGTGISSYKEYYDLVKKDKTGNELTLLLDVVSTNLTFFYREIKHFDFMNNVLIPELAARHQNNPAAQIRVWCAAASSGEEPYSILFTLLEHKLFQTSWNLKMLASDVSVDMLKIASEGKYARKRVDKVPQAILNKYFNKTGTGADSVFTVQADFRKMIQFKRFNLMTPEFPFKHQFDFIFCRNVMIYFDSPTREKLVGKFYKYLRSGGYLIVGHSESLTGLRHEYKYTIPTVYQK
ncbi:MAG: protein-glutamate O-methyltransferase CheR [Nitrospinota bacterium]|nr:protein-glutamate O-methyltransferase CheR [Nitrospinota bacterium]